MSVGSAREPVKPVALVAATSADSPPELLTRRSSAGATARRPSASFRRGTGRGQSATHRPPPLVAEAAIVGVTGIESMAPAVHRSPRVSGRLGRSILFSSEWLAWRPQCLSRAESAHARSSHPGDAARRGPSPRAAAGLAVWSTATSCAGGRRTCTGGSALRRCALCATGRAGAAAGWVARRAVPWGKACRSPVPAGSRHRPRSCRGSGSRGKPAETGAA